MISIGTSIISPADALSKVKVEYLYHSLCNPKPEIEAHIRQLRIVNGIDSKRYAALKKQLPYVVCAHFNPPYRNTANFAYTEYFIVDIDHVTMKGFDIDELRKTLTDDPRVMLLFTSPGEDGIKILFRLRERCYDAGLYSLFYKAFVKSFSAMYHLEQIIDDRTCDVCRACFVSIDREAFWREQPEPVDMNSFIDINNPQLLFDLKHKQQVESKEMAKHQAEEMSAEASADTTASHEPDADVLTHIRTVLGQKTKREKPAPYVPELLEQVMAGLAEFIEMTGAQLYEVQSIQYGKKLRMKAGLQHAEINLFYGKRGFSIVQTPKCGTSPDLNELMAQAVQQYLDTLPL